MGDQRDLAGGVGSAKRRRRQKAPSRTLSPCLWSTGRGGGEEGNGGWAAGVGGRGSVQVEEAGVMRTKSISAAVRL